MTEHQMTCPVGRFRVKRPSPGCNLVLVALLLLLLLLPAVGCNGGRMNSAVDSGRLARSASGAIPTNETPDGIGGYGEAAKPEARYSDRPGPYTAMEETYPELRDPSRGGIPVALKLQYPKDTGPHPLVIFSHGAGGDWSQFHGFGEYLASHGYVVFSPVHSMSSTEDLRERMKRSNARWKVRKILDATKGMQADPHAAISRVEDVSFLIDRAEEWNQSESHLLHNRIQTDQIAIAGHSFGACTVYMVCGARLSQHNKSTGTFSKGVGQSYAEPRVKAGIAMSPQGPESTWFEEGSYESIDRPMLGISGSRDGMMGEGGETFDAKSRFRSFELMPPRDKFYYYLNGVGHLAFGETGTRKDKSLLAPERPETVRFSKTIIRVYLDWLLKGDKDARPLLTDEAFCNSFTGRWMKKVTIHHK